MVTLVGLILAVVAIYAAAEALFPNDIARMIAYIVGVTALYITWSLL